jgi:hypothetical protein
LLGGTLIARSSSCVRWYLRYKLSLRDLVEMMAEGSLDISTLRNPDTSTLRLQINLTEILLSGVSNPE